MGKGLDVGTSFLITADETANGIQYKEFRDAFFRIKPPTIFAGKMLEKGLSGLSYFKDTDGSFVLVGQDAINKAIERNQSVSRPLFRGVISPREPDARRVLKFILSELVGKPSVPGEVLIYSVPAEPVDQSDEDFNTGYHEDCLRQDLGELGWNAQPLNEAEAIAYSELADEDYTGMTLSCLVPGTKIYTNKGIVNIEDVKEGDQVITHKGRWRPINKVITKNFSGECTKIQISGYSNNTEDYKFVDNHELLVQRNNEWNWIGCNELVEKDIVGEPILQMDKIESDPTITICEHTTSSLLYTKTHIPVTADVQRLIGYFLGDGSINEHENALQFDFAKHETNNIQDVKEILAKNFHKNSAETIKDKNCVRLKCYSKGLVNWFKNHCYTQDKKKQYPWSISRIKTGGCANLLAGLVRSDGYTSETNIVFENTNSSLCLLAKQLFARLNIAASLSYREPRLGGIINNRQIIGKQQSWSVSTGAKFSYLSLKDFIDNVSCETSIFAAKIWIDNNFACGKIQKIEKENYKGIVYDLQVEEDHSFSGPNLTIHNCGAGMVNICVMSSGDPVIKIATTKSGDFIDRMAAQSTGQTDSVVQVEKENGHFIVGQEASTPILNAVSSYYVRLIDYTVKQLVHALVNHPNLPKFTHPITIVVSGGTSRAGGFVDAFRSRLLDEKLPFEVKEVRHATDPLRAVARGCMIASSLNS